MIMDRFRSRTDRDVREGDVRAGAVDNPTDQPSNGRSTQPLKRGDRVLDVENLYVDFGVNKEWVPAAIDLTYHVDAGEVLAIVGESGSGKSASSMALLGLLPSNSRVRGSVRLAGREILGLRPGALRDACTMAEAHITQGSSVTYSVVPFSRYPPSARAAARSASISACAVGSQPEIGRFAPVATTTSPRTRTAPTGTSPAARALRAASSALRMKSTSVGLLMSTVLGRWGITLVI